MFNITSDYKKDVLIMLETLGKRKAFEETNRVLEILSKSFTLCIDSTTDNDPLFSDLHNNNNINIDVNNVFTSESLELYKPQKDFYKQIIQKTGFKSKEVLFVGDSLIDDVYGPKQLDITTCWLNRKQLDIKTSDIHPDYIINNLNDLLLLPILENV